MSAGRLALHQAHLFSPFCDSLDVFFFFPLHCANLIDWYPDTKKQVLLVKIVVKYRFYPVFGHSAQCFAVLSYFFSLYRRRVVPWEFNPDGHGSAVRVFPAFVSFGFSGIPV